MNPKLLTLLVAACALASTPTADQALTHLQKMDEAQRAALAEAYGEGGTAMIAELLKPKTTPAPAPKADPDADEQVVLLEKKRSTSICNLAQSCTESMPDETKADAMLAAQNAIAENLTLSQAGVKIRAAISLSLGKIQGSNGTQQVHVGEDSAITSLAEAIPQALFLKANQDLPDPVAALNKYEARTKNDPPFKAPRVMLGKVHDRALSLRKMSLLGMYKLYLQSLGAPRDRLDAASPIEMADAMGEKGLRSLLGGRMASKVAMLAESSSDFANITLDAINKSLRFFYLDAPRTWDKWLQRQTNPDFKNINRVALSESPSLVSADEGGPIQYVTLGDSKETYVLKEYKGGIKLTRRAIINDDMGAFGAIPRLQSNAAMRLEEDTAYGLLNNGTVSTAGSPYVMSDTYAVFDTTNHANYTSVGTALSISALQVGVDTIIAQKGPKGAAFLELEPKFLIVPTSIYWAAWALINSEKMVASQSSSASVPSTIGESNPFYRGLELIRSTRLRATSTTAWFLAADYRANQVNTGELCFLESEPEPVLRMETDFDTEDVKYAVRHTVAGKIIDYRGFYKNAGA